MWNISSLDCLGISNGLRPSYHLPCFMVRKYYFKALLPEFLSLVSNIHKILQRPDGHTTVGTFVEKFTFISVVVSFLLTTFPTHSSSSIIVFMVAIFVAFVISEWIWNVLFLSITNFFFSLAFLVYWMGVYEYWPLLYFFLLLLPSHLFCFFFLFLFHHHFMKWEFFTSHKALTYASEFVRLCFNWNVCPVGWGCRIHQLLLCRGVRPPPHQTSVLNMTLNNLMVRFQ